MITKENLAQIVGPGQVSQEAATLDAFARDMSFVNAVKPKYVVKPKTAQAISGRTFLLAPNALSIRALRLDFDAPAEATFMLDLASEQGPRIAGVGLGGVYRPSRSGRPVFARGYWANETTFAIEYNEGPGFNIHQMRARFDGDQVSFEMLGFGIFEGTVEQP